MAPHPHLHPTPAPHTCTSHLHPTSTSRVDHSCCLRRWADHSAAACCCRPPHLRPTPRTPHPVQIVPVVDGCVLTTGVRSVPLAGAAVSAAVESAMRARGEALPPRGSAAAAATVRRAKEANCYVCAEVRECVCVWSRRCGHGCGSVGVRPTLRQQPQQRKRKVNNGPNSGNNKAIAIAAATSNTSEAATTCMPLAAAM
eukprot:8863-Chlamydomonas_euryale.AAC.3